MTKRRAWIAMLSLTTALILPGCGDKEAKKDSDARRLRPAAKPDLPPTAGSSQAAEVGPMPVVQRPAGLGGPQVDIVQDSVENLLLSSHAAMLAGDVQALTMMTEPRFREAAMLSLRDAMEQAAAEGEVARAVQEKLGAEAARPFRRGGDSMAANSPLAPVIGDDGKPDWSRVRVVEEGDRAKITIDGEVQPFESFVKVDDLWYVAPIVRRGAEVTPEAALEQARANHEVALKQTAAMWRFAKAVRDGEATAENLSQKYVQMVHGEGGD